MVRGERGGAEGKICPTPGLSPVLVRAPEKEVEKKGEGGGGEESPPAPEKNFKSNI